MPNLEADNIGEPVIMEDTILIPIGDTVFSGKLEMTIKDLLFFSKSLFVNEMTEQEQMMWNLELIEKVESKFTPSGVLTELKDVNNLAWIITQWMEAVNRRQQGA